VAGGLASSALVSARYRLRPGLGLRLYLLAFGTIWVGVIIVGAIGSADVVSMLISAGMLAFGVGFVGRTAFALVEVRNDGMLVRNVFHTRFFGWDEIEGFSVQRGKGYASPWGRTVVVLLTNGEAQTLDATLRYHGFTGGHDDVVEAARRLKISLKEASQPPT